MRKVFIEKYRGYDIEFDIDSEKFQCIVTDNDNKESKSLTAVRKFVDEYKKANQAFSPFDVVPNPARRGYSHSRLKPTKVVGLRKDDRFIIERNGEQEQLSDYSLDDYVLKNSSNDGFREQLEKLRADKDAADKRFGIDEGRIINSMDLVTLRMTKEQILQNRD